MAESPKAHDLRKGYAHPANGAGQASVLVNGGRGTCEQVESHEIVQGAGVEVILAHMLLGFRETASIDYAGGEK